MFFEGWSCWADKWLWELSGFVYKSHYLLPRHSVTEENICFWISCQLLYFSELNLPSVTQWERLLHFNTIVSPITAEAAEESNPQRASACLCVCGAQWPPSRLFASGQDVMSQPVYYLGRKNSLLRHHLCDLRPAMSLYHRTHQELWSTEHH